MIPVTQRFAAQWGVDGLGAPRWSCSCCGPVSDWIVRAEIVFLDLGLLASLYVVYRIAAGYGESFLARMRTALPWAGLVSLLFAVGVWILLEPMEMRGTMATGPAALAVTAAAAPATWPRGGSAMIRRVMENRLGEGDSPILLRGLRKIGTVPGSFRLAKCLAALAAGLAIGVFCPTAWADGGAVVGSQRVGVWQVSVLASPTALAVGPADVSVLVQDATSGSVVDGLTVTVDLAPAGSPPEEALHFEATRAVATNKLFYAAQFDLPSSGRWTLGVAISDGKNEARIAADVEVAGPPPKWVELWPWIAWPALVVALFIVRERLVFAQRQHRIRPAAARLLMDTFPIGLAFNLERLVFRASRWLPSAHGKRRTRQGSRSSFDAAGSSATRLACWRRTRPAGIVGSELTSLNSASAFAASVTSQRISRARLITG